MNLPPNSKYFKVSLITFGVTSLYLAFGFFRSLWPYQNWFKPVSTTYALSLFLFIAVIIISSLYSLINWFLSKRRNKDLNPAIAIGPVISFTILIGLLCAPYMPKFLPSGSHLKPFNSELWIADDSTIMREGINDRQKMLGDVVENILPGKSRNEIIRHLGLSSDDSLQPTLRFYLGPARGHFWVLEEWLEVYLDSSGHFAKYEIFWDD